MAINSIPIPTKNTGIKFSMWLWSKMTFSPSVTEFFRFDNGS